MQRHTWVLALLLPACSDDGVLPTTTAGPEDSSSTAPATTYASSTSTAPTTAVDPTTSSASSDSTADLSSTAADTSPGTSPDTSPGTTTGTTTVEASTSSTTADTDTSPPDDTSTTTADDDTSTGDPLCGNGFLDPGEQCDDGNNEDFDTCEADCTYHECGDGVQGEMEPCDDGNTIDEDECTNACELPACGDGLVQGFLGEQCDDGDDNGDMFQCTAACKLAVCGDGLHYQAGELCDDGNDDNDDFCDNDCLNATCTDGKQNGAETDVDCGGFMCDKCPFLLLLGGNADKSIGGHYDNGTWSLKDIPVPAVDAPDIAITTDERGVGVLRYTKLGDPKDQQLQYVTWQSGVWSAPKQLGTNTTRSAPSIYSFGTVAHAAFQGTNFQYYYAAFDSGVWSPTAEPIGSFGPGPGSLIRRGGSMPGYVYHDGSDGNMLKLRVRQAKNMWVTLDTLDTDTTTFNLQPATAPLIGNFHINIYARNNGGQLRYSYDSGTPQDLPGAQTSAPPAVSGVVLPEVAYRGLDGRLYVIQSEGIITWLAPVVVLPNNAQIYGAPTLAPGIDGAEMELVYLDLATRRPTHVRRIAGVWTAPVTITDIPLERVAIDRSPFVF